MAFMLFFLLISIDMMVVTLKAVIFFRRMIVTFKKQGRGEVKIEQIFAN